MKKLTHALILFLAFSFSVRAQFVTPSALPSGDHTTATVADASLAGTLDCIDYCVVGICLWLVCTPFGCSIEESERVRHNLPDLVVSTYPQPGENSYAEARAAFGGLAKASLQAQFGLLGNFPVGGGDDFNRKSDRRTHGDDAQRASNIDFKEVSIVGNPFTALFQENFSNIGAGYICPTETLPFVPYYQSELDGVAWRTGISELVFPQTFNPLSGIIGNFGVNYWGRLYPRQGFVHQRNAAKASWVMASRAMHVTTRSRQPHLYLEAPVPPFTLGDRRWQLIAPQVQGFCSAVGENPSFGLTGELSSDRKYGWLYWAEHECCTPNPGVLIGVVPIPEICL